MNQKKNKKKEKGEWMNEWVNNFASKPYQINKKKAEGKQDMKKTET